MTKTNSAAQVLAASIRAAAEKSSACLVSAFPEQLSKGVPLVVLKADEAARLLAAAPPRIIYLVEIDYDPDVETAEAEERFADVAVSALPPDVVQAFRKAAVNVGQPRTTLCGFMIDGLLHTVSASAEWYDGLEDLVDEAVEAAREDADGRRAVEAATANKVVAAKTAELAAHPSFNFGRVSFEKRLTLAEALFGDDCGVDLREVTRCAENLFWLEQSGFTR